MSTDPNYVSLEAKQTWTVSSYPLEPSAFGSAEKVTSEIFCAFWLFTCPGKTAAYRIDGAYRGWRHTRRWQWLMEEAIMPGALRLGEHGYQVRGS